MHPNLPHWKPRSEAQRQALACDADILLFGGAAGSLKSETMLVDALAERENSRYHALLLRRTYPELEQTLIRRSRELYPGEYNETKRRWRFPSGAVIQFGYCNSPGDIYNYQGTEYSFIGFDESTHFTELPIRYLLSRLRSTDPQLKLRVRLATNPGNVGHVLHKKIFIGARCFHCGIRPGSRLPGKIYDDALWPSDGRPIGRTTCFIPGRVTDHDLLGADYIRNLESLGGAFRTALLEGCWEVFEGQYFDNWNPQAAVVPRALIPVADHWPHWVGIDYGFNVSQAAAYLLCKGEASERHPDGCNYVLEEFTAHHLPAADFALACRERFAAHRRVRAWYLSPDAWGESGGGLSLADQMTAASGIGFEPASNDRIGGAMKIYSLLDHGDLVIAEGCLQLREALPSRTHDPARPDDILKVPGDPLDDCIDALRYAIYSFFHPARTEAEIHQRQFVTSDDPTIAALQRLAYAEAIRKDQASTSYCSPRPRRYV